MKNVKFLSALLILTVAGLMFRPAAAQLDNKNEKEQEQKIQEEIDRQKKEMTEQRRIIEEHVRQKDIQQSIDEAMKAAHEAQSEAASKYKDVIRDFRLNKEHGFPFGDGFIFSPDHGLFYPLGINDDTERTTWNFSKSIRENSFSREYSFDVEESANNVMMAVTGNCREGEIRIRIVMPSGKTYSDIVIDESGDLNWRKSFRISEEENEGRAGEWKFKISASKATGYFKISLQAY
ncbi:MAG: hypothetical protein RBR81_04710 [Bacteroidales bacterium]|jgi:hypothetical protein|nr:hypothetical protein [Bacteroidales bacterium]